MLCYIYRSNKKPGAYLYLPGKDDFDDLPETMMQLFGDPEFSMSLNLTPGKKLAQEDTQAVLDKLETDGYYLQLPKTDYNISAIEEEIIKYLQPDSE